MSTQFDSDITQFYRNYFPERNGITPKVDLNVNYTNETLKYMSKPWSAKYIADTIEEFTQGSHYFLIEICAGTGGNTVEFLSRPTVSTVMSFERDPMRAVMLKRNINAYKLGDKAIVFDTDVKGTETYFEDFKNSVFFIDAPWLPSTVKNAGSDYTSKYVTEGMKIGDLTLEGWLEKLKDIAYIVAFKQPPKYKLGEVAGWTYYKHNINKPGRPESDDKNGLLYICVNNSFVNGMSDDKFGGVLSKKSIISKLEPLNQDLATRYENFVIKCNSKPFDEAKDDSVCQKFVKYGFVEASAVKTIKLAAGKASEKAIKRGENPADVVITPRSPTVEEPAPKMKNTMDDELGVPLEQQVWEFNDIPTGPSPLTLDNESPEWVAQFQKYISVVLSKFIKDSDKVNSLVNDNGNIDIWIQAFTHKSMALERTQNYEELEFIGDGVVDYAFKLFMYNHPFFRNISNGAKFMTSLKGIYMSFDFQSLVASKTMKVQNWIRVGKLHKLVDKNLEDVFESFIGALHQTGDRQVKGRGAMYVRRFIDFLGEKIVFNYWSGYGDLKQRINQNLDTLAGVNNTGYINKCDSMEENGRKFKKCYCKLTEEGYRSMVENGFTPPSNYILGVGKDIKQDTAEKKAALDAYYTLRAMGITQKIVNNFRTKKAINEIRKRDPELIARLERKLDREGYKSFQIEKVEVQTKGAGNYETWTLRASQERDAEIMNKTLTEGGGKNKLEAQMDVINEYLSS